MRHQLPIILGIGLVVITTCCACTSTITNTDLQTPYGPWLWNNKVLPKQIGLDDSVFVGLVNDLPGVKMDSVFHMLSSIGYGPSILYNGPTRRQYNFAIDGISFTYIDSNRNEHLYLYVYADKLRPSNATWDELLSTHVERIDVLHINFNDGSTTSSETHGHTPREKTGYRVTKDSREWFGPDDNWR